MKKFAKILFLVVFVCLSGLANAQPFNITGHTEKDTCDGNVRFLFTVNTPNPNLSFTTYYGDGNSKSGPFSNMNFTNFNSYATQGTYTVKHILKYMNNPVDSVQFSMAASSCNAVRINIFNDANSNCVKDISETISGVPISIEIDSAGTKIDTVAAFSGYIATYLTKGYTYTFKILNLPLGAGSTCPASGMITTTIPLGFSNIIIDFGIQCSASVSSDLAVNHVQGRYRPVNYSYAYVYFNNNSCSPQNGTGTITLSSKYNLYASSPAASSVSGNVLTYNFSALGYIPKVVMLALTPATTLALGDTVCLSASITPAAGTDINLTNNTYFRCDTVIASFDPNSKEVSPQGNILPGTTLNYTINFENMGSDTAFNIHILDTLSEHVDINSFSIQSSSHRVIPSINNGPNGKKILKFGFEDIRLPDTSHPEANKGYVKYSINAKTQLAPLTQIENRAGIYFDINPVVMTNSVLNWINDVHVNDVVKNSNALIYPNPTDGVFIIKTDNQQFHTARLVNPMGQLISSIAITGKETKMDTGSLPAGIYYVILNGNSGSISQKVQKQ